LDFDRIDGLAHSKYDLVNSDIVSKLRSASELRWKNSEDFAKELRKIELYKRRLEQKTRTINEEKFRVERKEFNTDDEEEKLMDRNDSDKVFDEEDFYNAEVLNITRDYLNHL